ncbi:hypothetical protein UT300012_32990 [Paraclostridium bifermentans]
MENLHKIELYVVDYNNQFGTVDNFVSYLEDCTDCMYHVGNNKTVEIEWSDDLDINKTNATTKDHEKYLEKEEQNDEIMKNKYSVGEYVIFKVGALANYLRVGKITEVYKVIEIKNSYYNKRKPGGYIYEVREDGGDRFNIDEYLIDGKYK